ncbi:helix-turn-helix transcriptional regulator [Oscillibacter sp. MSJ-2]|uniref:Helix-turn-helix transcriptional regulator n=1 Tax=Dysosmobacter acutus TaxID=2841504 RepID=A0ABS6F8R3_9FIRM|nr:helix-turn-helix transcriptional regulator [Dysosmobacter acutus]MBU5625689.1 helix-turn-helix transcriptional regulator [Dysosmobacter acutus]
MKVNTRKIDIILAERFMTKTELANLCGISTQVLYTVVRRGAAEPRTVGKIAAGLGIPVDDIMEH